MILHVVKAKYVGGYKVEVTFNDERTGIADLEDVLGGPVFEALREKSLFSQLNVDPELATISWPNGADLAPEYIYFKAFGEETELEEKFKRWGYLT